MAVLHLVSTVVQVGGAAARLVAPRHQHLRAAAGRQHVPLGQRRGGRCEGPGCRRVSDSTQAHRLRTSLLFPPYTPTSLSCNISFKTLALQTGTRRSLAPSAFPPRPRAQDLPGQNEADARRPQVLPRRRTRPSPAIFSLHPLRAAADATLLNNASARRLPRSSISHSTCSSPSLVPMSPLLPPALANADASRRDFPLSPSPGRTGRSASATSYAAQDEFLCPISFVTETTRRLVLNCFRNIVFCFAQTFC